jgi:hypothetical protein
MRVPNSGSESHVDWAEKLTKKISEAVRRRETHKINDSLSKRLARSASREHLAMHANYRLPRVSVH